ncbi:hypothetical protein BN85400920 [Alteracholeplasma palmae J233]|uniref:Uncharacterized protein n=1 Tax=Alteracholeplasma palmae (strain ATCC 49389 / J233) TaxID=1318466 RepID=U4KJK4_ALTPJ|nr:hypothetical protein [Alteracholeplasma palmae]CCV63669.1 hypothetical protein BN85400920 [Alteracholeplasma palmae J233]
MNKKTITINILLFLSGLIFSLFNVAIPYVAFKTNTSVYYTFEIISIFILGITISLIADEIKKTVSFNNMKKIRWAYHKNFILFYLSVVIFHLLFLVLRISERTNYLYYVIPCIIFILTIDIINSILVFQKSNEVERNYYTYSLFNQLTSAILILSLWAFMAVYSELTSVILITVLAVGIRVFLIYKKPRIKD